MALYGFKTLYHIQGPINNCQVFSGELKEIGTQQRKRIHMMLTGQLKLLFFNPVLKIPLPGINRFSFSEEDLPYEYHSPEICTF